MTKADLTPADVTIRYGYGLMYVYALLRSGQIPGAHKVDGQWRIPESAIDARIAARRSKKFRPVGSDAEETKEYMS